MKKMLLIIAVAFAFAACVGPAYVTSMPLYDSSVETVIAGIESEGYRFVDKKHDTRNERFHMATPQEGTYSDWVHRGIINVDTYSFVDSADNRMSFTVEFKGGIDHSSDKIYCTEVAVVGCSTSEKADYERLCGKNSPVWMLDTIKKDMSVKP